MKKFPSNRKLLHKTVSNIENANVVVYPNKLFIINDGILYCNLFNFEFEFPKKSQMELSEKKKNKQRIKNEWNTKRKRLNFKKNIIHINIY